MITVTDSVMHLDCQRQQPFAVPFKELTHGENRQQELTFVKDIDVEARKLHPGHHGDVEGVGRGCVRSEFSIYCSACEEYYLEIQVALAIDDDMDGDSELLLAPLLR